MAPLVVDDVHKSFTQGDRAVSALSGVSIAVERGRFLAIMGASGSGKSTLLHLMAALTKPDRGKIIIDNQDLSVMNDKQLTLFRRRSIGLIFQSFNLIPTLTAEENVRLPLMLDDVADATSREKIDVLMESLGIAGRKHHRPDALSGGEQQRVAIGRALVAEPAVILADEPTGNLDSVNSVAVCELLRDLCAIHGKTIVMVTHEPSVAAYAQEVAVIQDGKLIDRFETAEVNSTAGLASRYQEAMSR